MLKHDRIRKITALMLAFVMIALSGCSARIVRIPDSVPANAPVTETPPADGAQPTPGANDDAQHEDAGADDSDAGDTNAAENNEGGGADGAVEREPVKFGDMRYVRPDFDETKAHIERVSEMVDDGEDAEKIAEEYDRLNEELNDYYTQFHLLNIFCAIDVTDREQNDEYERISSEYHELTVLANELDGKIADSYCRDTVLSDWTDANFEYLEISRRMSDNEYIELRDRKTQIGMEYWDVYTNTVVDFMGRTLSREDIDSGEFFGEMKSLLETLYYEKLDSVLGELYLELIDINKRIAEKAGFDSYNDFSYYYDYDRDYTPEDSERMCEAVKKYIPDEMNALYGSLGYEEYQGLSAAMTAAGQLKVRKELIREYADEIGREMPEAMDMLIERELSVLTDSAVCQGGAFTTYLVSYEVPVIYVCLVGGYQDVLSFLHEFGHFYGYYVSGIDAVTSSSLDVEEIMSQANELLFTPYFETYMDVPTYSAVKKAQMFSALYSVVNGCIHDEFQRYVYDNDVGSVEELNRVFAEISSSYGVDQSFYSVPIEYAWVDVSHTFEVPLYFISYATSQIPALEIFVKSLEDREGAIGIYNAVVHSDPRSSFRQVLEDCGLDSPFEEDTIKKLVADVRDYIGPAE